MNFVSTANTICSLSGGFLTLLRFGKIFHYPNLERRIRRRVRERESVCMWIGYERVREREVGEEGGRHH